ncbi:hypothetical protein M407DRAFT_73373 [Tulasnella calospora MUT 4182]|uniref:Cation efflux protein transmembrane domain-containing protein n=1 Tax=Tulasnella calospora MUT 4182 TaxID=1051891 RepID=A0A0C3M0W3_9AGAM|nr:hypothetical protein M407DRAFT_73373 [Tulasnella calospora MUT 4182]
MSGTISITPSTLPPPRYLLPTFTSTFLSAVFISKLGFAISSSWSDLAVSAVLYIGCSKGVPSGAIDVPTRTGATRTARTYLKVIMENDESRKIFYFLMVNMAYMVVQLLWGFWTNSLGLVSDAIHMFFDCLSVGVGLMASVMANWPPNESFTYGYGRIETISGFANGIFLILISIFIAFEAVQRIIDPPEMGNFRQLLHDHGHSHNGYGSSSLSSHSGHGHSHDGHGHGHSHDDHDDCDHDHHDHGHSHNGHGLSSLIIRMLLRDTLGSVGVIISTILIELYRWTRFDPIASLFIAVLIAASVIPLVIECGKVLCLDIEDKGMDVSRILFPHLFNTEGVAPYSEAKFWPKDSSSLVGSIHVRLTTSASSYDPTGPHSVKKTASTNVDRVIDGVNTLLKSRIPGLDDLSIQVEGS